MIGVRVWNPQQQNVNHQLSEAKKQSFEVGVNARMTQKNNLAGNLRSSSVFPVGGSCFLRQYFSNVAV